MSAGLSALLSDVLLTCPLVYSCLRPLIVSPLFSA